MASDLHVAVGNVKMVVHSLRVAGQRDEDTDYIAYAHEIVGDAHSPTIRLGKPGSAEAALDQACRHPWVVAHSTVSPPGSRTTPRPISTATRLEMKRRTTEHGSG